jgi:hypothetical protein
VLDKIAPQQLIAALAAAAEALDTESEELNDRCACVCSAGVCARRRITRKYTGVRFLELLSWQQQHAHSSPWFAVL